MVTYATYMVTVESSGFSADWLDDVIVVDTTEKGAIEQGEKAVREYRPMATIKDGQTEVYKLATQNVRVIGILVPREER